MVETRWKKNDETSKVVEKNEKEKEDPKGKRKEAPTMSLQEEKPSKKTKTGKKENLPEKEKDVSIAYTRKCPRERMSKKEGEKDGGNKKKEEKPAKEGDDLEAKKEKTVPSPKKGLKFVLPENMVTSSSPETFDEHSPTEPPIFTEATADVLVELASSETMSAPASTVEAAPASEAPPASKAAEDEEK